MLACLVRVRQRRCRDAAFHRWGDLRRVDRLWGVLRIAARLNGFRGVGCLAGRRFLTNRSLLLLN
tara:strand:- start:106 stop:300 length:195 start_codon:yes stop_codon:yes gene_type:complete